MFTIHALNNGWELLNECESVAYMLLVVNTAPL